MKLAARALGICLALALGFAGWGYWGATRAPVVVRHEHVLKGLPTGMRLKLLLLSDTHYGQPDMPDERLAAIVEQANALKPDLILLAGDYIGGKTFDSGDRPHLEPAVRPLSALSAPLGVFAVLGNHDNGKWGPIVFAAQARPRLLVNHQADVGPLVIAGVNSTRHGADFHADGANVPPGKPLLLLRHEGDFLLHDSPPPGRSVLALAGHTHGGQILLPLLGSPGEWMLGEPRCRRGLCHLNGWPLYVTSGIGTSWLPLRINVQPEMVLITLVDG
jgi:predicted MPP superfamily phosphohydrolase